jgi:hypothetical protein
MTRPFCPHGHLTSQDAIERAALKWFPEEIAALNVAAALELAIPDKLSSDNQEPTSVGALARALASPASISDILRQQIADVLIKTEHRLRQFLHQGVATAYYFGGLAGEGRHTISREFWATNEADGLLVSGFFWPFGKPRSIYEQRPNHPLFLLESDLNALLSADPKSTLQRAEFGNEPSRREFEQVEPAMTSRVHSPEAEETATEQGHREVASQPKRRKSQPLRERARRELEVLYPSGVPDAVSLSDQKLCTQVSERLKKAGHEAVSNDTILRAAGRRR